MIACDLALVKSGTSTLEAMLLRRPMRYIPLGLLDLPYCQFPIENPFIAVPNILAGRMLVPELVQKAATPDAMCEALEEEYSLHGANKY